MANEIFSNGLTNISTSPEQIKLATIQISDDKAYSTREHIDQCFPTFLVCHSPDGIRSWSS